MLSVIEAVLKMLTQREKHTQVPAVCNFSQLDFQIILLKTSIYCKIITIFFSVGKEDLNLPNKAHAMNDKMMIFDTLKKMRPKNICT